ncbi:puromycin-sensitive aminopeptidase-like [Anopheles nili]|uniref:puromycin-sensitive aminopeptidase-like n=1 Tax=Anopheles nili TaxID=185578 RepID=UPI00237AF91F|nr:puromycin-sensitive aminopeptidase-like [Anopheles nili]
MKKSRSFGTGTSALLVLGCLALAPCVIEARRIVSGRAFDTFRLPNSTVPTHYTLRLDTDVHQGIFDYTGNVQIRLNVVEATDQIVLHSSRSVIENLQLRNSAGLKVAVKNYEHDEEKEFLVINLASALPPNSGTYTLEIDFTNSIERNDQAGFYRSSYEDDEGVTRYLGLTQFESVDARTSFPCYDEPGIKTTYDIIISCGIDYHARSNAPLLGIQLLPGGKKLSTFATTPRMQSYLVAWLVSDFVYEREVLSQPQLAVATWSKPSSAHLLSYSVDASVRFIRAMEEYFGELYTMSKIDNVAIKDSDYSAGAMENWGLVTYRESAIFYEPEQGEQRQIGVVTIVGHEFTHQFFGNLLAPKWWSYLWLNEGFARLYQYYVGEISHPELNLRERFVTSPLQTAFRADGSATIRPMTYYTETRQTISRLFDSIAYDKSASVLRMMNYALGERTFQKGLRYYVQQNKANGVVDENNLFASLEQAAKEDAVLPITLNMHDIFRSWTNQAGVPVVKVRRDGDEYLFTQERYYAEPQDEPAHAAWWIPISFSTPTNTAYEKLPAFWMPPHVSEVSYTIPTVEGETVSFNPHSTGYYRIEYDEEMLREIVQLLNKDHTTFQPAARARLIDDTLNIAHTRGGDYDVALQLMNYLSSETDYQPWMVAHENIRHMQALLRSNEKASRMLESFVEKLATPLLERHGVVRRSGESASAEELRSVAIELACSASETCQNVAQAAVRSLSRSIQYHYGAPDASLLCNGLQQTDAGERQSVAEQMSRALPADNPFARQYLQKALGCMGSDMSKVQSYAKYLFDLGETDRSNALHHLFVQSEVPASEVIESIRSEMSLRHSTVSHSALPKVLLDVARYVTEPSEVEMLTSVAKSFASWIGPELEQRLSDNRKWIERNAEPLTNALNRFLNV